MSSTEGSALRGESLLPARVLTGQLSCGTCHPVGSPVRGPDCDLCPAWSSTALKVLLFQGPMSGPNPPRCLGSWSKSSLLPWVCLVLLSRVVGDARLRGKRAGVKFQLCCFCKWCHLGHGVSPLRLSFLYCATGLMPLALPVSEPVCWNEPPCCSHWRYRQVPTIPIAAVRGSLPVCV